MSKEETMAERISASQQREIEHIGSVAIGKALREMRISRQDASRFLDDIARRRELHLSIAAVIGELLQKHVGASLQDR